jgi:two-component system cell cycle sensor histidine kinase/response regulator CckA
LDKSLTNAHRFPGNSFPQFVSVVTIAFGVLILAGWATGNPLLTNVISRAVLMKANSAVGFVLAGISLLILSRENYHDSRALNAIAKACAIFITILGAFTLVEHILSYHSPLDPFLFFEPIRNLSTANPGSMAPHTGLNFLFLGLALVFVDRENSKGYRPGQILPLAVAIVSSIILIDYFYRGIALREESLTPDMSIQTASFFLLLSVGLLYSRANSGFMKVISGTGSGSVIARNLLPFAFFVPLLLGWIILFGVRIYLYDAEFGLMLFAMMTLIIFSALIWANAGYLNRSELAHADTGKILQQSEERFRATFEQAAVGIAHVSLLGQFIRVNQKLCDIVGYSRSELLQKTFQEITFPDDLGTDLEYVRQMLSSEISTYGMEKRYIQKDGGITWIHLTVSLVREPTGDPKYFISVIKDINDQKRVEEEVLNLNNELEQRVLQRTKELLDSEEKYRTLFEESQDAVFMSTPEGRFLDINPAGIKMFGYNSKEELLSIDIARDQFVNPEQREQLRSLLHQDGFVKDFELPLKKKSGEILTILETSVAVHNAEGKVIAYQGILRDITRLKQLQNHVLHSHKLETIGRLAGGVAHDFNNLLMAINSYCELILMKVPAESGMISEVKEILKAVERASSLTKQLLAFGRKQLLSPKVFDMNSVLINMRNMIDRLSGENVRVLFQLAPDIGNVMADTGQIEQVILNLVVNGRDAMPNGGTLTIETGNRKLDERYKEDHPYVKEGDYVLVTVTDDGEGMDEETVSHIFEPFFTTKEHGKGTGLGLATVYGIIKQSDGYIEVFSKKNQGSGFEIYLPQVDETVEPLEKERSITPRIHAMKRILIVDDNEQLLDAMSAFLKNCGYEILSAKGPYQAMEIVRANDGGVDLLITDVLMPNMNGRELSRKIMELSPGIKVLFISGYVKEDLQELSDVENFLPKPTSMAALLEKINTLLA